MKIAFHSEQLGLRGSEITLHDFATYNETILGNESYIVSNGKSDHLESLNKFKSRFPVFLYDQFGQTENFVRDNGIDAIYYMKAGLRDGKLVPGIKNMVHAVFWFYEPHGDVYA